VAAGTVAAGAGCYGPLPCLFLHFKSNIYMYIQYFNNNKLWVPKVPRVLYSTAQMTGHDRYYPSQVMVSAGTDAVWENPTCGVPVLNPNNLSFVLTTANDSEVASAAHRRCLTSIYS